MLSFTTNELEIVYTPDEFNNSCDVREEISKICEDGSKIMVEKLTTVFSNTQNLVWNKICVEGWRDQM